MTDSNDVRDIIVPPVGRERHYWKPSSESFMSRTRRVRETGEYFSAVPARLADRVFAIPASVAANLEESAKRLGEFDSYSRVRLGRASHALGPMSAILLRTESASSSQIEQITVGARNLALQEIGEGKGGNAEVVVGNVEAMRSALKFADDVSEKNLLAVHSALLGHQRGWEQYAGRYRDTLVWVGGDGSGPRTAAYVAPQPEMVRECMDDLLAFLQRDDLPVLFQIAIGHAQFETIHPFVDGNGRVGRALIHVLLRNKKLVVDITPPVSAGLLAHTSEYFNALMRYRDGDALPVVDRLSEASDYACSTGKALIDELAVQLDEARRQLKGVRHDAGAWKVLPILIEQPVLNLGFLVQRLSMSTVTASRSLHVLENKGVLVTTMGGRRNRVWEHKGILAVLDDYAAKIRRSY